MYDDIYSFMINFLISNLVLTGLILLLFLEKRLFRNLITARAQFHIWTLFLVLLPIPVLPIFLLAVEHVVGINLAYFPIDKIMTEMIQYMSSFFHLFHHSSSENAASFMNADLSSGANTMSGSRIVNDFAISVNRHFPDTAMKVLFFLWLCGMLIMLAVSILTRFRLHRMKQTSQRIVDHKILDNINHLCHQIHLKNNVSIYQSECFKTPVLIGVFHPVIYLPTNRDDISSQELNYMLLHELQHMKHKDNLVNQFISILKIFYWFHPLIWMVFREIRLQRELSCDNAVLHTLSASESKAYGITLLHYIEKMSVLSATSVSGFGGSCVQIRKRIEKIATFLPDSPLRKHVSRLVLILTSILLAISIPFFHVYAMQQEFDNSSLSERSVTTLSLDSYFKDHKGSFVLYDSNNDNWQIYHMTEARTRISPDSTYKIYDAMMGLEMGQISPQDSVFTWDHTQYPFSAWNQDQNVTSAIQNSVNWYFQRMDQKIGCKNITDYLTSINYGNHRLSNNLSDYWQESTLKISPIEQVENLQHLFQNDYNFHQENVDLVRDSLKLSEYDNAILYGKTGTGNINGTNVNGWFIGAVETNGHLYYFALNIHGDHSSGTEAAAITHQILKEMHLIN